MTIVRRYEGSELGIFRDARVWKRYFARHLEPCLRGDVLEVGAGIGSTTSELRSRSVRSWTCLEPDPSQAASIRAASLPLVEVRCGTIDTLGASERFDAILYVDVLEHIEDDGRELQRAGAHLRAGGHLVVLAPAHAWLFTEFDAAIGHFRRYDRASLAALAPPDCVLESCFYLDAVGMLASAANRWLLRQLLPTHPGRSASRIACWFARRGSGPALRP